MKAWVLNAIGDIRLKDADMPKPEEGMVLIRVKAAGICGSDIPRIYDTGAHRMPLIPGHEFSGVVESTGRGVDPSLIGKKAAVFPKIACGKCPMCLKGKPMMCLDYDYVGSRRDGAFAEFVTAPAKNLIELPEGVSFEAAAMLEPFAVASNAVRSGMKALKGASAADISVAVCGLGTIGLMVIMLLKEAGFSDIYAIGNKESQLKKAVNAGIDTDHFINSRSEDAGKRLKEVPESIGLYFECVGSNESINYGLDGLGPEGTLILVGNPRSDMIFSRDTYWKILRQQLNLKGIWNSTFMPGAKEEDDWQYVLGKMAAGKISPEGLISHRFSIDELEKGFVIMRDKTEDYCKIMMVGEQG